MSMLYQHGFSASKLAGDIVSFFTGFSIADTKTPILSCANNALGTVITDAAPNVLDDLTKAGAALLISFLSRVLFDSWERFKAKQDEKRKTRKSKKDAEKSKEEKQPE